MNASDAAVLLSAPFPLTLRNFVPTGLAARLEDRLGMPARFVSPYAVADWADPSGRRFANHAVPSGPGDSGVPSVAGVTALDRIARSVHLTGFAVEYPDGSLQNIELSRRRSPQRVLATALTTMVPRRSAGRRLLRRLAALYRPRRAAVVAAFDATRPAAAVVASPGHYWLDHFVLDEARRRGIPAACVVLSWDNLYSRGPMIRRPDRLLVWSDEMRRQALDVHQFPADAIDVVGALQFLHYATPPAAEERGAMRARIGLGPDEPFLAYVCGARTSTYDVEDVLAMRAALESGPFAGLRVVVRPHPQGSRATYESLLGHGILLDRSPDLTARDTSPAALDVGAIRQMASLLAEARFVVSSWGTTALLEACIFDTPGVQLRWMDAVPHAEARDVRLVRDFQRYIHMRAFDATGARPYSDRPADLAGILAALERDRPAYAARRAAAVERLVALPLGGVVERTCDAVAGMLAGRR